MGRKIARDKKETVSKRFRVTCRPSRHKKGRRRRRRRRRRRKNRG
jgi:hypothetical protein